MAKVNNQEVIQKLIDELKLYPGADVIPTEIADKILPCFLINSQEIEVSPQPVNIVASASEYDSTFANHTIYTTSSTQDFYLTNVQLSANAAPGAAQLYEIYVEGTIDGSAVVLAKAVWKASTAGNREITINFQNPIKLDQGTTIDLKGTANIIGTSAPSAATIFGYNQ